MDGNQQETIFIDEWQKKQTINEGKQLVGLVESSGVKALPVSQPPLEVASSSICNVSPIGNCNFCDLIVEIVVFSDDEEISDGDSLAQSDIVLGLKVKIVSNPRNMAELGVSPREMGRPMLNFAAFEKQELKDML